MLQHTGFCCMWFEGIPSCTRNSWHLSRELVDGVVLVDNSAISAAIKDVFNETRSILEPAGAVAVAGAKAYLSYYGLKVQAIGGQGVWIKD